MRPSNNAAIQPSGRELLLTTNSSQGARQVSEGSSQGEQGEGVPLEKQASAESDAGRQIDTG